jgi:hypothetical protein
LKQASNNNSDHNKQRGNEFMWNSNRMNWGNNVLAWVTNVDESWVHHYGPEIKHWCRIQEMIISHAKKAQSLGQKDSYTIYSYVELN